jgi:hypothetical protein
MEEKTMTYARTTTVDAAPAGDVVKQAVLDVDTDLTGIYANLNTHETATTGIHGAGSGTLVSTTGTQTLTAKTISGATITGAIECSGATLSTPTITGATISNPTITGGTITGATFASPTLTAASDTAYGASWDNVTDISPSKNAVYDKIELLAPKDDPTFTTNVTSPKFTQSAAVNYFYAAFSGTNVVGNNTLGTEVNITTNVTWSGEVDTSGVFSNGKFTAPDAGLYFIAFWSNPSESKTIISVRSILLVDNTNYAAEIHTIPNENFIYGGASFTLNAIVYLTAGQYVNAKIGVLNDAQTKTTEVEGWMSGYRII